MFCDDERIVFSNFGVFSLSLSLLSFFSCSTPLSYKIENKLRACHTNSHLTMSTDGMNLCFNNSKKKKTHTRAHTQSLISINIITCLGLYSIEAQKPNETEMVMYS